MNTLETRPKVKKEVQIKENPTKLIEKLERELVELNNCIITNDFTSLKESKIINQDGKIKQNDDQKLEFVETTKVARKMQVSGPQSKAFAGDNVSDILSMTSNDFKSPVRMPLKDIS